MSDLLSELREQPLCHFDAGDTVIAEGASTGLLYFLVEGVVEVTKNGVSVTRTNEPGAVFGDLSALLGVPHTAEVKPSNRAASVSSRIRSISSNPIPRSASISAASSPAASTG